MSLTGGFILNANQIRNMCLIICGNSSDFSESKLKKKLQLAGISPVDDGKRTYGNGLAYSFIKGFNKSDWLFECIIENNRETKNLNCFKAFLENSFSIDSFQTVKDKDACIDMLNRVNAVLLTAGYQLVDGKMKNATKAETYASVNDVEQVRKKQTTKVVNWQKLSDALIDITRIKDNQSRGYAFEKFLNLLFNEFELAPRLPYKITGEQIDGSFEFLNEVYILEAKYKQEKITTEEVVYFVDKINAKSGFTRGIFFSYSIVADYVYEKYDNHGAKFFIILLEDIFYMLKRKMPLPELLSIKSRALAEEGKIYVKIPE